MKPFTFIKGIVAIILVGLVLSFRNEFLWFFSHSKLPEQFGTILYRVVLVVGGLEALRLIMIAFYRPAGGGRKDNITVGISHIARIIYAIVILVMGLSFFNIGFTEALTSLSFIAAALVIITTDYISTMINGMYLTFAHEINIGDTVKIGENRGKIMDITLTNVHLLNEDDDIVYLPNNAVFTNEIINYTRRELKKSSVDFELSNESAGKVEELETRIIADLAELNNLIQPGTAFLKVSQVKFEYSAFKFQYILQDPLNKEHDRRVRRKVVLFILAQASQARVNPMR
ncbi:MAG: mechanosensitive ion channel family protein [Flavobacteriales bacterium]